MRRTAGASTSARFIALPCSLIVAIGLAGICQFGTARIPETLAIRSTPVGRAGDDETIEFQLDAAESPAEYLITIASLGDAAEITPVRLEARQGLPIGRAISLNRTPATPFKSRPLPAHRATQVPWKFRDDVAPAVQSTHRLFFLQLGTDPCAESSYHPVETRLVARSSRISIWQDLATQHDESATNFGWLADTLEHIVLPRVEDLYGEIADLDGDGTLSICLTPRLAQLPAAGVPVEGLVQFNDFLPGLDRPFSNRADVLFLSADLQAGLHATAILAHETAHLAVFSRRRDADPHHLQPEEDWLNEGLAHYAEIACGGDWSNLQPRIAAFRQRPALSALLVQDAARQGLWRDPSARGAAWSFINWLANEYGPGILREIASEPGSGCDRIEQRTGEPFEELFRQWTISHWHNRTPATAQSACEEFSLRGSGQTAYRVAVHPGERCRLRIKAPTTYSLQVTVVDRHDSRLRYWAVR